MVRNTSEMEIYGEIILRNPVVVVIIMGEFRILFVLLSGSCR